MRTARRAIGGCLLLVAIALPGCAPAPANVPPASGAEAKPVGIEASREGIQGDPVPLDTSDPKYRAYFEELRQRIKQFWGYPCVRQGVNCDHKSTETLVEFGVSQDGRLAYVKVLRGSPWQVYDDAATAAIKLGSPFRPVPAELLRGNGLSIVGRFIYNKQ